MAVYQHDVLVVGAGLAGMRATLAAQEAGADVAMITKVHPVRSHSNAAHGGIAEDSGFTVSFGDTGVVLGFSMSGNIIPATSDGILTNLSYTNITSEICINDVVLSDPNGIALEIDLIGDCIEY